VRFEGTAPLRTRVPAIGILAAVAALAMTGTAHAQRQSGIQLSPDSARYLISKDVGQERWAITYNLDDKTVTGNVFPLDGGNPSFLACVVTSDIAATIYDLSCQFAQPCPSAPCSNQWGAPFPVPGIPRSFFLPTDTQATFAANVQPVFNSTCATNLACHAPMGAGLLDLSSGVAYAHIFDVVAQQAPSKFYVDAFAPDASYLMNKIDGTGSGSRMPLGGPFLSAETADMIRRWIAEGAANN
jgi:hypothetical protein